MSKFYYEAHNKWGEPVKSSVEASTEDDAAGKIRAAGLFAREISAEPLGKTKYDHGAVAAGPVQPRVYQPGQDDIPEASEEPVSPAESAHVNERGKSIGKIKSSGVFKDIGSLRMDACEPGPSYVDQDRVSIPVGPPPKPSVPQDRIIMESRSEPEPREPEPAKFRKLKKTYEDEKARQKEIEVKHSMKAAWYHSLVKELEGVSTVLGMMETWRMLCHRTPVGGDLPSGVPSVGGKTWKIYDENMEAIAAEMIKGAMARAAQRMPLERLMTK